MIRTFLNKTFGIRDGEIYISFLMQIYIFLIINVLLIIKPIVNALFLSELGAEQLPYGYLMVALIAVITTYFYNRWVKQFSFLRVTSLSLLFFSFSFIALGLIITFANLGEWLLYTYYIGVSLFAVITTSQFWILANLVFNSREGKRLFGFIGAGAIAGGIFGGYLTSLIASAFGNVTAIIIAGIFLLVCIPILRKIWSIRIKRLSSYVRAQRKYQDTETQEPAYKIISKSKHLTYLALITGFGVIVAKLVDFQFSDFANKAIRDPDELASFFGFWFSSFNVIALCLQLFVTNKVLSKLGVASTLLILPLGLAVGSLLFLTFPELWVLVIIKGIDGSFKQSLNKAAVELSVMPIPFNIKNQAKSFIDVAVDSIATGLAGLMLILFIKRFDLPTTYITVIILLFTFVWIILIYKLREAYFNSFRQNIRRNLVKDSIKDKPHRKETAIGLTRSVLQSGDEDEILAILDRFSIYKIRTLRSEIIALLDFPSNKVKTEVIKQLYKYDKGVAIEKIKPLIYSNDDQLVQAALSYILEHSSISQYSFFNEYLDHSDPYISSSALLCLSEEISDNQNLSKRFNLEQRIVTRLNDCFINDDELRAAEISKLLLTIANAKLEKYYTYINVNLQHKNPIIVKSAIEAAGLTSNEQYTKILVQYLAEKPYRKAAINALKNYSSAIANTILKLEKNDELNNDAKRHIPTLVRSFNNQKSVKILMRLLKSKDVIIRFEATKALIKLKSQNENLYFNKRRLKKEIIKECRYGKETLDALASIRHMLASDVSNNLNIDQKRELKIARKSIIVVLDEQLITSLKSIFKLLALLYDEADIEVSYSGLMSEVKEAQINALEFLDNLLQSQLKEKILPLVEYYNVNSDDTSVKSQLQIEFMSEYELIRSLLAKRGKRIKLEVLYLISTLKDKSYRTLVHKQTFQKNKEVQEFAIKTLAILDQQKLVNH
ncbi:Npt1/Npt2 family nucleotide transporter [Winogradskyella ouciana]|uniref:ADP,ATP carrier protein n=1 Tax=Winogradskyella ouciana TaxID=2608631 RepID=A0A7K1G9Q4_9FLAO|nr:Npt1/Npt2 family nucleotide transporter [Winogradskyella ouciana]MTE26026.1 MFS transporter [Winogradskyella ouciana]